MAAVVTILFRVCSAPWVIPWVVPLVNPVDVAASLLFRLISMVAYQSYEYAARRRRERNTWTVCSTQPRRFAVSVFDRRHYSHFTDKRRFRVLNDHVDAHGRRTTVTVPRVQTMTRFASSPLAAPAVLSPLAVASMAWPVVSSSRVSPVVAEWGQYEPPTYYGEYEGEDGEDGEYEGEDEDEGEDGEDGDDGDGDDEEVGGLLGDDVLTSPVLGPRQPATSLVHPHAPMTLVSHVLTPRRAATPFFPDVDHMMESLCLDEEEVFSTPQAADAAGDAAGDADSWASLGTDIQDMNVDVDEEEARPPPSWFRRIMRR